MQIHFKYLDQAFFAIGLEKMHHNFTLCGGLKTGFFFTKIKKTQGGKNSPNSITQDNFSQKTQQTGSIFQVSQTLNENLLLKQTQKCEIA